MNHARALTRGRERMSQMRMMMRRFLMLASVLGLIASASAATQGCGSELTAKEKPQLTVSPSTVRFDAAVVGAQAVSKQIFIGNSSDAVALTVSSVELVTDSPLLTLFFNGQTTSEIKEVALATQGTSQIDLFYNPTSSDVGCGAPPPTPPDGCTLPTFDSDYCGHLVVLAPESQDPCFIIPVYISQNAGRIQVSVTELAFEPSPAGDTRTQTKEFLIENVGANSLTLKGITLNIANGDAFTLGGASATERIPPGGASNYSLSLQAKAVDVGASTGTLVIDSDDPNKPTTTVRVQVGDPGGASVTVEPRELIYVNVVKPNSDNQTITVTNTGAGAPVLFTVALRNPAGASGTVTDFTVYDKNGQAKAGPSCEGVPAADPCRSAIQVNRSDSHELNITYAPQGDQGSNAELVVRPQGLPEVVVPLTGTGGVVSISYDPTQINFTGPANNGDTVSEVVTFTNIGGVEASVTSVSKTTNNPGSCDHFAVTPEPSAASPVAIPASSGTAAFTITFTRPDDGPFPIAHQCDITFTHSGGTSTVTAGVTYP
jgi:hypothetical protein